MLIVGRVLLVLVVSFMLLLAAWIFVWTTEDLIPSPDGASHVLVQTRGCMADCILAVKLQAGWRTITLAERADCAVGFAYAKWFDNVVAVLVDGVYCGDLNAAYDLSTNQPVDYEKYKSRLTQAIIEAYGASPGTPAIREQYYRRKKRP